MKVACDGSTGARSGRRIAPAFAGAVVPANASELGDFGPDFGVPTATTVASGQKDDGGRTFAGTVDIQSATANIDSAADTKAMLGFAVTTELFVRETDDAENHDERGD
ncbi:MAG TPA: hypothetical protein VNB49_18030 [Candidatus Dormibacteraeota bacterium]|nr:hypothetical protein [Candidatus Dormibacteraeota bacterium]